MCRMMKGSIAVIVIALSLVLGILPLSAQSAKEKGPIRIGYLTPSSGPFAALGQYLREGFELYLDKINYKVADRKIEVFYEDTKMDPRTGLIKAKKLVEEMKVQIIAGVMSSAVAYAIKDYIVANKIPFISTNAAAENLTSRDFSPYFFRTSNAGPQTGHVFGDWLYKQGYKRLIVMSPDYSAGYEYIGGLCRVFTNMGGEIAEEIYWPLGNINFAPYLAKISPSKADGVVAFGAGTDVIHLVKQYSEYGLKQKIPLFSLAMITSNLVPEIGDAAVGVVDCYNYKALLNLETKEHKEFIKAFKDKYGKLAIVNAEQAYVGAQLIVKSLELIGGKIEDTDAFIKAMETVDIVAPRGPFKLDKYHNPVQNVYISTIKKKDSQYYYEIMETYTNVGQFWKWSPEEYMKMPAHKDLKGQWGKKK